MVYFDMTAWEIIEKEQLDLIKQSFASASSTIEDRGVRTKKKIVWHPMVIIMNTTLEKDDNGKWIGWDITSCMTFLVLILLPMIFDIKNDHDAIMASGYWFLRPLWDGIKFKDKKIVWPQILIIMNTTLEKDNNDKWIGRDIWSCMKILSSYTALKDFVIQNDHKGKHKFCGYMKEIRDMENYNKHLQEKSRLKFEIKDFLSGERKAQLDSEREQDCQGEVYERWDDIEFKDKEILWLPMLIIMKTTIEKDDNDKSIGWDIRSCMTISVLMLLSSIFDIQNDHITIVASMYWFLRPLSWDTWRLYFSLSSFLRKKEIKICGYSSIRFYPGGNLGFMVTLKKGKESYKFIKLLHKKMEEFVFERENMIIRAHEDRRHKH
ncbi:hypothetical protein H5410_062553 [Solanum commersonii]|uniref:XS domain-containing protein n=1 Tax=Solanum commersonii TaxID=4109 RepID=A0A9J5WAP1_SOLCO|nr:hypothetical protein H5410_062553 [Solanum commersonii]